MPAGIRRGDASTLTLNRCLRIRVSGRALQHLRVFLSLNATMGERRLRETFESRIDRIDPDPYLCDSVLIPRPFGTWSLGAADRFTPPQNWTSFAAPYVTCYCGP